MPTPAASTTATFPKLQPGDVLLYDRQGFVNWAIKVKTWSKVSHVEVVADVHGTLRAAASRNGVGCGIYDIEYRDLAAIVRAQLPPTIDEESDALVPRTFDSTAAVDWFFRERIFQQRYDWLGLFNFYIAAWQGRENGRMFCSEFAVRFLRAGGVELFRPECDADSVAPGEFLKSAHGRVMWSNGEVL